MSEPWTYDSPKLQVNYYWQLTPELSRPAERARRWFNHSASAETAKRARLERIVRRMSALGVQLPAA